MNVEAARPDDMKFSLRFLKGDEGIPGRFGDERQKWLEKFDR
jgi:hypothetical protein